MINKILGENCYEKQLSKLTLGLTFLYSYFGHSWCQTVSCQSDSYVVQDGDSFLVLLQQAVWILTYWLLIMEKMDTIHPGMQLEVSGLTQATFIQCPAYEATSTGDG